MRKIFKIILAFCFLALCATPLLPDTTIFQSPLIWRTDGRGDYPLAISSEGTHESNETIFASGTITSITATWQFTGEVTLEVSADNGINYVPVVCGVPLTEGFVKGSGLKWRANVGALSELTEVAISYTDSSGVVGTFGNPDLSDFRYRKPVFIKGVDETLYNYQLKIAIGESQNASDFDVQCEGNIRNNFKDIRFTLADAKTTIPYFLESTKGAAPNRTASVWVKIPQLPPSGIKLYLYYGNANAPSVSSPHDVFDLYDDFDSSLDQTVWEASVEENGSYSVSDSYLTLDNAAVLTKQYKITDGIIEYRAKALAGEIWVLARADKNAGFLESKNQGVYSSRYQGAEHCIAIGDIVKINEPLEITDDTVYDYRVLLNGPSITFTRFLPGFGDSQSEVSYDDTDGLTQGSIGLKAGAGRSALFDWIRVRRYSPTDVTVDKTLSTHQAQESTNIPTFYGVTLSNKGELILDEGYMSGSYVSQEVLLPYEARIFIPNWKLQAPFGGNVRLDVSLNAGADYRTRTKKGAFYYASRDDFVLGDRLKIKLDLNQLEGIGPIIDEASIDHRPGVLTLISPNGNEELIAGSTHTIQWSAVEYQDTFPLKVEFTLDDSTYESIVDSTPNTGSYDWILPEVTSITARVKVSDAQAPDTAFDISDGVFSIVGEGDAAQEATEEEIPAEPQAPVSSAQEAQETQETGSQLYDLLIKIGDNHASDPQEDQTACYKDGDIVVIKPAGYIWGKAERENFLIVQMELSPEEVKELTRPKEVFIGEKDKDGKEIKKIMRRRKHKISLQKLGIKKKKITEISLEEEISIKRALKDKKRSRDMVEEK